jgi:uncharacterized protein YeaO (DUF488 family)
MTLPLAPAPLRLRRVHDRADASDGVRVLVDRLWPRGISKQRAHIDAWLRELSPSHELRRHFHGHPELWDEFVAAYALELQSPAAASALQKLHEFMLAGPVTLLYAARDETHNNAVALKAWLEDR